MPLRFAAAALALLVLALVAFWPQYLSKPLATIDVYTHVHAALGTLWVALLIAQPLAIRAGARPLHRRLGRASYLLGPAFVVSGLLLAHYRFANMAPAAFAREAFSLYLPLMVGALFAAAYALAVVWRRQTAVHARFMACTALLLIDPVVSRIIGFYAPPLPAMWMYQGATFGLTAALMIALLRTLPPGRQGRSALRAYVVASAAAMLAWFVVPHTGAWLAFADAFRRLPLT
jgi:uncharacterized membrane protein YozB (DUF420 family)